MQTAIYKQVVKIYYAVANRKIGCIDKAKMIINLYGFTKQECETKVSDWCANQGADRRAVDIKIGFLPGEITNHWVP